MGAFEYTALDEKGRNKRGVLEGDTPRQIRHQLRTSGWTPLSVEEVSQSESKSSGKRISFGRGISAMDLALVTRQFATLLQSGLPIEETLAAVAKQSGKPRLERIILAVRSRVREGHSLASALSEFPAIFPELYIRTVEAGESSGHIDVVLNRLADYTESRQQMRQKTVLALFYPAMLVGLSVLVVSGLLAYVVPEVVKVFDNTKQELPFITQALMATSDFMRAFGGYVVIAILGGGLIFSQMLKQPGPRRAWHLIVLRLPLIGRLTRSANAARFARTLSILVASSVPILDALRISSQVLTNLPMRKAVQEVASRVREGSNLSNALERTGYFPPMTLSLIASGEASGALEEMLDRAASIQEREIESLVSALLGLFEPILILVMGIVVLIIVLGILLPVLQLNQLVG